MFRLLAGLMVYEPVHAQPVETVLHVVRRGDTPPALTARYLGRASPWRQPTRSNGLIDPRHVAVGTKTGIQFGPVSWRPQMARLVHLQGTASVVRKGARTATPLTVDDRVTEGDAIGTGSGSFAVLLLSEGTVVHMQANTTLRVSRLRKLPASGASRVNLRLEKGRFDAAVTPVLPSGRFEVSTPLAIAGVRGTRFGMTALHNGAVSLDVLEGAVEFGVRGARTKTRVDAGAGAMAVPGTKKLALHTLAAAPDLSALLTLYEGAVISMLPSVPAGVPVLVQIARDPALIDVLQSKVAHDEPVCFSGLDDGRYYLAARVFGDSGVMGQQSVVPIRLKARREASSLGLLCMQDDAAVLDSVSVLVETHC